MPAQALCKQVKLSGKDMHEALVARLRAEIAADRRKGERRTIAEANILYLKNDRRLVDRRKK